MASPSMVQRSGDTLIVRSVVSGDRLFMEMTPAPAGAHLLAPTLPAIRPTSPPDDDRREDVDLPQCKIKRNYNCPHCNYFTQNPRHNLTHLRDVHDEKVKIYDCPNCLYASKHFQKLLRHMKMVHGSCDGVEMNGSLKRKLLDRTLRRDEAEAAERGEEPAATVKEAPRKASDGCAPSGPPPELGCSICSFTATNQSQLARHERKEHTKTKFFPCSKCNYVTHIKARFTKHVKYHSMPMIKCEVCDFRTPYKWNLDRHMKNHGGTGAFCCSVCNFTADIKQSLTVHEMNHHVPAVGQAGVAGAPPAPTRRRNKVGGSDAALLAIDFPVTHNATPRCPPQDHDASTCDSAQSDSADPGIVDNRKNYTENNNRNVENIFYGNFTNDLMANLFSKTNSSLENDAAVLTSTQSNEPLQIKEEMQIMKKIPRPIPNLIPLHLQNPVQPQKVVNFSNGPLNLSKVMNDGLSTDTSVTNMKELSSPMYQNSTMETSDMICQDDSLDQATYEHLSTRGSDESSQHSIQISSKNIFKRKNASFFDKLKEKLLTTTAESGNLTCKECGHLSKCLSEYSVHEKLCNSTESKFSSVNFSASGSTRCQHCRHRCKSSLDLIIHTQSCLKAGKDRDSPIEQFKTEKIEIPTQPESEEEASVDDPQVPHPMENVVFVWNSMLNNSNSITFDSCLNSNNEACEVNDDNMGLTKNIFTSTPNSSDILAISGNTPTGKKVFKCPHCSFWASTASRFHVHIVGHLNKKPFECSFCSYRSNWRWDITKHIRLKSVRDPEHNKARVLMTDETGRRNYSKYNKYLTLMHTSEPSDIGKKQKENYGVLSKSMSDISDTSNMEKPTLISAELPIQIPKGTSISELPNSMESISSNDGIKLLDGIADRKMKKSMWKCKKCSYRHSSKEALLIHVRKHSKSSNNISFVDQKIEARESADIMSPVDISGGVSYRCGHCNQVSNWKHVIQRHCRLKHNGDVRVIVGEKCASEKISTSTVIDNENSNFDGKCTFCPFTSSQKNIFDVHIKQHSMTALESSLKCFLCPYYAKTEADLVLHLQIHDVLEPEQYIANILGIKSQTPESFKRYKCIHCPYESNSKSQFMYHERFHKPHDAPFKCDICNYQVTKRHLLHQHMKVHNMSHSQKETIENIEYPEKENYTESSIFKSYAIETENMTDIPLTWVSFEGEFQKMYKCRYCPYVKLRKSNIQDHEKMHQFRDNLDALREFTNIHQCSECSYACNNVDVFLSHSRVHEDDYAKVLCLVNLSKTDERQISELKDTINELNLLTNNSGLNNTDAIECDAFRNNVDVTSVQEKQNDKVLYFCNQCPARFLCERELQIHNKLHSIRLPYQCETCSYTARQQAHLMAHKSVHGEDYQLKTKALQIAHRTHPDHPRPKVVGVVAGLETAEPVWIVVMEGPKSYQPENESTHMETSSAETAPLLKPSTKQHLCTQCPAKFFKSSALHYHLSLHGGDGKFKCKKCNYAVKTIGNLARHETVHGAVDPNFAPIDYESSDEISFNIPISGTDLFQHKTEVEKRALTEKLITRPNDHFPPVLQADPQFGLLMHGNPDFIYPTYLKNGRQKEKRYKCHKCPSAFEKREQYKVHLSLHGSKQRYKCEACDYSVKYYANYVQHMRKHQMNADAHVARQGPGGQMFEETDDTVINKNKLSAGNATRQGYQNSSKLSISDQQTLKLLHRRRSSAASKDTIEEKKIYRCTYCPYTNQRRDALDNHMRRHNSLTGINSNYACPHCDYAAPQSQFLREHLKIHFNTQKHVMPDFFANFDSLEISMSKINDSEDIIMEKTCIFKISDKLEMLVDSNAELECKHFVIPSTGERIEG